MCQDALEPEIAVLAGKVSLANADTGEQYQSHVLAGVLAEVL